MTAQPPDSGRLRVGSYLIVGAAYFATAVLGQSLVLPGTNASPVWPPAGVAVAAVWLLGVRVWPAGFIGSLCGNVIGPLLSGALPSLAVVTNAAVAAVAGTVEAALGVGC